MVSIKGSAVIDSLSSVRARLGEAGIEQILGLLDPETRGFFREEVMTAQSTAWVPLDRFVEFLKADLIVSDGGREEALIGRAEATIERQLRGIYRVFVRLSRPDSIVERIAAVNTTYFQGVGIERHLEEGKATVRHLGFQMNHHLMEYVILGFYQKALQLCGAKAVEAQFTKHIRDGGPYAELQLAWR
jgi:hypothetical protein